MGHLVGLDFRGGHRLKSLQEELRVPLAPSLNSTDPEMLMDPTMLRRNVTALAQLEHDGKNVLIVGFDNGDVVIHTKDNAGAVTSKGFQVGAEPIACISYVDFSVTTPNVQDDWTLLAGAFDTSVTTFIYTNRTALTYDLQTETALIMDGIEDSIIGMKILKTYTGAEIFVFTSNMVYIYCTDKELSGSIQPSKCFSYGRVTINKIEHYKGHIFFGATRAGELLQLNLETDRLEWEPVQLTEAAPADEIVAIIKKR